MLKTALLIIISFFAVIGILECIASILESISLSKYDMVEDVNIRVSLKGEIENIPFLLNTLLIQAERINYKDNQTRVVIVNKGLCQDTYNEIIRFCLVNKNITVENSDDV